MDSQLSSIFLDTCQRDSQGVTAHLVSLQSTENSKPQVTEFHRVGAPSFFLNRWIRLKNIHAEI